VSAVDPTPPPGAVFELAERTVDFVRKSLNQTLDYSPETLPILDHYLRGVPKDQPDTLRLIAACAGAYFGEVARQALGGEWEDTDHADGPAEWILELGGAVRVSPFGMAALAILGAESDDFEGGFAVTPDAQDVVEAVLAGRGRIAEDEYYTLSSRLEVLMLVVDTAVASRAPAS
jgi:hypothetical protein